MNSIFRILILMTPSRRVLKAIEIALLTISLLFGMYLVAESGNIDIKTEVKPDKAIKLDNLTVGDRFVVLNTVKVSPSWNLTLMPPGEKLGDADILSPPYKLEKSPEGTTTYACTLAVYQPGPAKIPTLSFRDANSSDTTLMQGDTLTLAIKSVLPPDTTGLEIADIKGPRRLQGPIWPYLLIPLVLAALIFGGMQLRKRFTGKVEKPSAPPTPPWILANKALDTLKAQRYVEFGKFRQYYFELSLIVRTYIEGRYETPAAESTTVELEENAALKEIPEELYSPMFEFFYRADLVKFAKSIPSARIADQDLSFAYDFVARTKPQIAEPARNNAQPTRVEA